MSRSTEPLELPGEIWRAVAKYPGYEVSNFGRFRSYWTPQGLSNTPRIKMIIFNRYMKVAVHTAYGNNTLVLFAKLVAEAFIGRPRGRIVVYLDGDIRNCRLDNLAYATRKDFGNILSQRRFEKDPINSRLGKEAAIRAKREKHYERARSVKRLRDEEKMTYKQIGKSLGISESGAYRIYAGANNHLLEKALTQ